MSNSSEWNDDFTQVIESWPARLYRAICRKRSKIHSYCVITPEKTVLDVGCATGSGLKFLREIGFQNLYGIDLDSYLLKIVPKSLAKLCKGSVEKMPFEDESFDYILCQNILHHLTSLNEYSIASDEMFRVLKPGGIIFISEPARYGFYRYLKKGVKIAALFSDLFKKWGNMIKEEDAIQSVFMREHDSLRKYLIGMDFIPLVDSYFLLNWNFTIKKT